MNIPKKTIISTCLLLSGAVLSSAAFAGTLNNKDINVRWEVWDISPKDGGTVIATIDEIDAIASDQKSPDIKNFHNHVGGNVFTTFEQWDVDFIGETIELTYTSRYVGDENHQYMYSGPEGFHFEDTEGNLPSILGVTVDDSFAPFGFESSLVSFDENNIYVDLDGSMCHIDGMGSMPDCANAASPTKYDNQIKLNIRFASGGSTPINRPAPIVNPNARIDQLLDWAERTYPQFFPSHKESSDIIGYRARHYPSKGTYLGVKDNRVYVYSAGIPFNGMQEVGGLQQLLSTAGL
jgi:hypothetical protein